MPIRCIVDGFFRSGTTMVWKILRDSNPGKTVFYEPLNPAAKAKLALGEHNPVHRVHGIRLWGEYAKLGKHQLDYLDGLTRQLHKKPSKYTFLEVMQFFDGLPGEIILQTNRLQPYMKLMENYQNVPLLYIIRNPKDVLNSIERYVSRIVENKGLLRATKEFYWKYWQGAHPRSHYFGGWKPIDFMFEQYRLPTNWPQIRSYVLKNPQAMYLINYVLRNYVALVECHLGKHWVLYEDVVSKPEILGTLLAEYDIGFNYENEIEKRETDTGHYTDHEVLYMMDYLGMVAYYRALLERLGLPRP